MVAAEFQQGLLGCFGNCGVCLLSYFVPCFQVGKTAESVGESFCYNCLLTLIPIANIFVICSLRGKVKAARGMEKANVNDLLATICCPFCTIAQMGNEASIMTGGQAEAIARE